ncbi:Na+/H+ antiporter subunit E [Halovenus salina]|uniref:Na+/H+ antiporter subunit E n=1 Tax=Halovenus salina TaxID=1510225 RepID=A0ABD5W129_9EURY|nr:Na+/H+ antiporter subunit E [Halovenus salina]
MKIRRWLAAGVLFAVVWVFVEGPALRPKAVLTTFLVGLGVGLPLAYLFRRLYSETVKLGGIVVALPYSLLYIVYFLKEIVVANVDVAYRVLAPNMPLRPQVILVPLRVETDIGVTTIANSITITPGTITLDHDPEENALYVHAIDGRHPEKIVEPIRQWEDYALVIFDEEGDPSDPAPEITVHPPGHPPEPKTLSEQTLSNSEVDTEETND